MKLTQMYQTVKFGLMSAFILMKSLFENKLHQTASKHDFFFFSIFFEIMVHLKCVKRFIKHARFIEFDELFDAFAPAFRICLAVKNPPYNCCSVMCLSVFELSFKNSDIFKFINLNIQVEIDNFCKIMFQYYIWYVFNNLFFMVENIFNSTHDRNRVLFK